MGGKLPAASFSSESCIVFVQEQLCAFNLVCSEICVIVGDALQLSVVM